MMRQGGSRDRPQVSIGLEDLEEPDDGASSKSANFESWKSRRRYPGGPGSRVATVLSTTNSMLSGWASDQRMKAGM